MPLAYYITIQNVVTRTCFCRQELQASGSVVPPASFTFTEQPTSHVLPTKEITSHESDTWPAGTSVPVPQTEDEFNEDVVGSTPEVVVLCRTLLLIILTFDCFDVYSLGLLYYYYLYQLINWYWLHILHTVNTSILFYD